MKAHAKKTVALVCGTAGAILIVSTLFVTVSRPANATSAYTVETGKTCGQCHQNAAGGGKLTPFGEKFKADGHKVK